MLVAGARLLPHYVVLIEYWSGHLQLLVSQPTLPIWIMYYFQRWCYLWGTGEP